MYTHFSVLCKELVAESFWKYLECYCNPVLSVIWYQLWQISQNGNRISVYSRRRQIVPLKHR